MGTKDRVMYPEAGRCVLSNLISNNGRFMGPESRIISREQVCSSEGGL